MLVAAAISAAIVAQASGTRAGALMVRLNIAPSCAVVNGKSTCQGAKAFAPVAVRRDPPAQPGERPRLTIEY